jgi:hypothetical protein
LSTITTIQVNGAKDVPLVYSSDAFPLRPQKSLTIQAAKDTLVTLHGSGGCGANPCTVQVEVAKVTLANLTIENPEATGDGVTATAGAQDLNLKNVVVTNCGAAGMRVIGAAKATLDTVQLNLNGQGLVASGGSASVQLKTTTVSHNRGEGVVFEAGVLNSTSSTFSSNGAVGVSLGAGSIWGTVKDEVSENKSHGAATISCQSGIDNSIIVDGSSFASNGGDGIHFGGCSQLTVRSKSKFQSNVGSGVTLGPGTSGIMGDGDPANDNTFNSVDGPNKGAGICNQTTPTNPPSSVFACGGVFSSVPPSTGPSCTGGVDIGNVGGRPVQTGTTGQCGG